MGYAYVEKEAKSRNDPGLYFSFINGSSAIGSLLFFIITAVCVGENLYVDIDKINLLGKLQEQFPVLNLTHSPYRIDTTNIDDLETFWFYKAGLSEQTWVGAWWVTLLLAMFICFICAVPVFLMKPVTKSSDQYEEQTDNDSSVLGDLLSMFKAVYSDAVVLFVFMGDIFDSIMIAGIGAFGVKFLMQNFWMSTTDAGLYSGLCGAAGSFVGLIINGITVKFGKFNTKQILLLSIIQSVLTALLIIPLWSLSCGNRDVAGFYRMENDKLIPSADLTGSFEPYPDMLVDTCTLMGLESCNTGVFEELIA